MTVAPTLFGWSYSYWGLLRLPLFSTRCSESHPPVAESEDPPADVEDGSEKETSEDEAEVLRDACLYETKKKNRGPDTSDLS